MYSKIKIGGHPLHPILVNYPIAFYTASLTCFIVYFVHPDIFWFKVALWSNLAGVMMAVVAALPGFIDWLYIPSEKKAKNVGMQHMLYNVAALMLFAVNLGVQYKKLKDPAPNVLDAIIITSVGLLLTSIAGYLGGNLMQKHHVGISLTEEQQKIEPADGVK